MIINNFLVTENQQQKEYMSKMKKSLLQGKSGILTNKIIIKDKYGIISQNNPFNSQPKQLLDSSVKNLLYFLLRNHQNHKEYNKYSRAIKQSLNFNKIDNDQYFQIRDYHLMEHHNNLNHIKLKYCQKIIRKINIQMDLYQMAGTPKCTYIQLLKDDIIYIGSYCLQKGKFKLQCQIQEPLIGNLGKDFNFLISNDEQYAFVNSQIFLLQNFDKLLDTDFTLLARLSNCSQFFISFGAELVEIYDLRQKQLKYTIIIPNLIQDPEDYYVSLNLQEEKIYIEDWSNSVIYEIKYLILSPSIISEQQIALWIEN